MQLSVTIVLNLKTTTVRDHARAAGIAIVSQCVHNRWIDDVPERVAVESARPAAM